MQKKIINLANTFLGKIFSFSQTKNTFLVITKKDMQDPIASKRIANALKQQKQPEWLEVMVNGIMNNSWLENWLKSVTIGRINGEISFSLRVELPSASVRNSGIIRKELESIFRNIEEILIQHNLTPNYQKSTDTEFVLEVGEQP